MFVALFGAALAADVLVLAPDGPLVAGQPGRVEVLVVERGRGVAGAAPDVTAGGAHLGPAEEVGPGRYRYLYTPAVTAHELELLVRPAEGADTRATLPVAPPRPPVFDLPADVEAAVGTPRIEVRFPRARAGSLDPSALLARVSEGRVLDVRVVEDAVLVAVEPGAERVARVMAVALTDREEPGAGVAFGLVRLRARPQLTIQAEPRSTLTVKVGRRSYGPFVADATGSAQVSFDALPGDTSYEVSVADDLGNTQRSTGPLPTSTRPVLVGLEVGSSTGADVWLGAWSATGAPWNGAPPLVRTSAGEQTEVVAVTRNTWRVPVPRSAENALFDPRVDVTLGEASLALRVPVGADLPTRVELQVYPDTLSADFPIAQVQAALLDWRGDRMDASTLQLTAARGELTIERTPEALRADYRGGGAVEAGGDTLTAYWEQPAGTGHAWTVEVWPGVEGGELVVLARARDRLGRPLPGVPVEVLLGVLSAKADTDARGWAKVRFPAVPADPIVLHVQAEALSREVAWLPEESSPLPDRSAPDLSARVDLPIRAGRVRQVFLDVSPRPLYTGGGTTATVTVRMLDAAGQPVRDERVTLDASEGEITAAEALPDGSFQIGRAHV